jgi:hypothetical protein
MLHFLCLVIIDYVFSSLVFLSFDRRRSNVSILFVQAMMDQRDDASLLSAARGGRSKSCVPLGVDS